MRDFVSRVAVLFVFVLFCIGLSQQVVRGNSLSEETVLQQELLQAVENGTVVDFIQGLSPERRVVLELLLDNMKIAELRKYEDRLDRGEELTLEGSQESGKIGMPATESFSWSSRVRKDGSEYLYEYVFRATEHSYVIVWDHPNLLSRWPNDMYRVEKGFEWKAIVVSSHPPQVYSGMMSHMSIEVDGSSGAFIAEAFLPADVSEFLPRPIEAFSEKGPYRDKIKYETTKIVISTP